MIDIPLPLRYFSDYPKIAFKIPILGAMYMIEESPGLETIFKFPMALAPTLVVPIFVVINLFVALRLMKRLRGKQ